jgi:hypothetical protein
LNKPSVHIWKLHGEVLSRWNSVKSMPNYSFCTSIVLCFKAYLLLIDGPNI